VGEFGEKLGVGRLIAASFNLVFRKLGAVALVNMVPFLLWITLLVLPFIPSSLNEAVLSLNGFAPFLWACCLVICLYFAASVKLVCDLKLGVAPRWFEHLQALGSALLVLPVLGTMLMAFVLVIMIGISVVFDFLEMADLKVVVLGVLLYLLPVSLIFAAFSVTVPAMLVEMIGLSSISRSIDLTKGYRWSIAGVIAVIGAPTVILTLIAGNLILSSITLNDAGTGLPLEFSGDSVLLILAVILALAFAMAVFSTAVTLTYLRLREIKENYTLRDLTDVFE